MRYNKGCILSYDINRLIQQAPGNYIPSLVRQGQEGTSCLLIPFSQQYPTSPPASYTTAAAFAVDGLMLPLTLAAVKKLPALSRLIQQALIETKPLSPTDTSDTSASVWNEWLYTDSTKGGHDISLVCATSPT